MKKSGKKKIGSTLYKNYIFLLITIFISCAATFSIMAWIVISKSLREQSFSHLSNTAIMTASYCTTNYNTINSMKTNCQKISSKMKSRQNIDNCDIIITTAKDNNNSIIFCSDGYTKKGKFYCDNHKDCSMFENYISKAKSTDYLNLESKIFNKNNTYFIASNTITGQDKSTIAVVFAIQSKWELYKPYLLSFLGIFIMMLIITVFLILHIAYIFTYVRLIKPLKMLSDATNHFANGDLSYRINISKLKVPIKEIEDIQHSINSMLSNLETNENKRNDFIANVSHELKTPMTTIGGFVDGMLDGTIDVTNYKYYLTIISDEIKRLSKLVTSMLNMSKIEAGEFRLDIKNFNLSDLLIKILLRFEKEIEAKQINIKGLDKLNKIYIDADYDMLGRVFYNLIDNAVKFTETCGTIWVYQELSSDSTEVTVSIYNTGKGIEKEHIDKIFDRFYKADKSRGMDAKSSGLGLFISKNIVELHSGQISVKSSVNEFTEFKVKLKVKLL